MINVAGNPYMLKSLFYMTPEELDNYEHIIKYNKIPNIKTKKFNAYYKELKKNLHYLVGDTLLEYAIYYYAMYSKDMKAEMVAYIAYINQDYRSRIRHLELSNTGLRSVISELNA